ncbi:uncharacterized protein LOC110695822 [Chenopodium quinoa]|uniref:uncharacterized protein LOC110695822 n=1 Tax=Chenopodium quinoa TaxID=63459 RepID=UPI000B771538|nr:uncharacterized protein LOC110695822 [Chenopodium quinoa]
MDRSWMYGTRTTMQFIQGVEEFVACAVENQLKNGDESILCPCSNCDYARRFRNVDQIREHLTCRGFRLNYIRWIWHGESITHGESNINFVHKGCDFVGDNDSHDNNIDNLDIDVEDDEINEMMQDVEDNLNDRPSTYETLLGAAKKPLYPDLEDMFPEGNGLPISTYQVNKMLCPMGMEYQKIRACPNDCILYRNEYKDLHMCPRCGLSRYKCKKGDGTIDEKGPPSKVLWYLPIIPRFKCFFSNKEEVKNLIWHVEGRKKEEILRHPADSLQWKSIDKEFPEFGTKMRNLRLGLCTDEPKQPGNDIYVYLAPLIDDLKLLWGEGVDVFDSYTKTNFRLRAMIFCTINDFPAYVNLLDYTNKGAKACPICEDNMVDEYLDFYGKIVYMHTRTFLPLDHPYRKMKKPFNGKVEIGVAWSPLTGSEVYERVKNISTPYGKPYTAKKGSLYKKKSPLWDLSYLNHLESFIDCLRGIKVPSGYSSNIKRLVSKNELNLVGMKSHDCHVMMQQFLPIAIRGILPKHVRNAITRLCFFFSAIFSKEVDPKSLDDLQAEVIVTLCQFEMYFPPSFFDVMVHVIVHLVQEIKICGPL